MDGAVKITTVQQWRYGGRFWLIKQNNQKSFGVWVGWFYMAYGEKETNVVFVWIWRGEDGVVSQFFQPENMYVKQENKARQTNKQTSIIWYFIRT